MDLCTAYVMQQGDNRVCYQIPERSPRTYAEIVLLRHIHGGEAYVTRVKKVGHIPDNMMQEKARLKSIYGDATDEAFPGINPHMPTSCEGDEYLIDAEDEPPAAQPRRGGKKGTTAEGFPA